MRGTTRAIAALLLAAFLLPAGAARAAPTCQTREGDTIRCGATGAMPVGWTIAPGQRRNQPIGDHEIALVKVILGLGLFFAFVALLPKFDGTQAKDWDREQDDDKG